MRFFLRLCAVLAAAVSVALLSLRWVNPATLGSLFGALAAGPLAVVGFSLAFVWLTLSFVESRWPSWRSIGLSVLASLLLVGAVVEFRPRQVLCRTTVDDSAFAESDVLVVYAHNVFIGSLEPEAVADQIVESSADVAVLSESDAGFVAEVAEALEAKTPGRFGHQIVSAGTHTNSLATFSRWPLVDVVDSFGPEMNPVLLATVDADIGPVRLGSVHLSAPTTPERIERWNREFETLPSYGADVLIGDFNATWAHRPFRELVGSGFVDAHREVGCGLGVTWTPFRGPGLLHLDHALVGPNLEATALTRMAQAGSDHQAIVVAVRPASK